MDENLIEQKAMEILSWVEDAVGDMSREMHPNDIDICYGKKWAAKLKRAKANGVTDLNGWLADEFYSDPDILQDLCGDRLYDAATQISGTWKDPENSLHFVAIANKMKERSHNALSKALDILIKRREACLK